MKFRLARSLVKAAHSPRFPRAQRAGLGRWFQAFLRGRGRAVATDPVRSDVPPLRGAEIAAVYYDHRIGGDFYEFLRVGESRTLFALMDMAGRRSDTRETLRAAQSAFRTFGLKLFGGEDLNEATAMMGLCCALNGAILERGPRNCSAFIGCYNEEVGTVCYANAGHAPALLRDRGGITQLNATGIPLGLFSHATQSASTCALAPGAALLAVSRGILEAGQEGGEFGLERAVETLRRASGNSAHALCLDVLQAVRDFMRAPPTHDDVTALVLARHPVGAGS